jgi:hypothetical protein
MVAVIPYGRSILRGRTKPHQFSWLILTLINIIVLVAQFLEGGRESILIYLVFSINCAGIFVLSLFKGVRNTSRWDWYLLAMALITCVVWAFTKNNVIALWLTVLIDIFATSMTLLKIRAEPGSEDPMPWFICTVAYIFTLLSLVGRPFGILYLRPYYGLCSVTLIGGYTLYKLRRQKRLAHETSVLMQ